ncbi:hypothetical protein ANO14919_083740 [Xylariales sp. No.14919]|nr:hypothetical protein ANO14919_083740 [Xylariales sp. No.14919]
MAGHRRRNKRRQQAVGIPRCRTNSNRLYSLGHDTRIYPPFAGYTAPGEGTYAVGGFTLERHPNAEEAGYSKAPATAGPAYGSAGATGYQPTDGKGHSGLLLSPDDHAHRHGSVFNPKPWASSTRAQRALEFVNGVPTKVSNEEPSTTGREREAHMMQEGYKAWRQAHGYDGSDSDPEPVRPETPEAQEPHKSGHHKSPKHRKSPKHGKHNKHGKHHDKHDKHDKHNKHGKHK